MKNTIFGQMLQIVSRYDFEKAVKWYSADKHCRGFSSWNQFVSLLFGQQSGQDGLRAYVDLEQSANHCRRGVYFVTRLKSNARYRVFERKDASRYKNISLDQIIEFSGFHSQKKCSLRLRRMRVKDPWVWLNKPFDSQCNSVSQSFQLELL